MKTLFLMRHAKSSWDDPKLADQDRPLAPRGHKAAARMAEYLRKNGVKPSVVLCTSAKRARQTLEHLRPALPKETTVKVEPRLYTAGSRDLMTRLRRLSHTAASVLVVGHNPAMQELVMELASKDPKLKAVRNKFPTAALAVLKAPTDEWRQLSPGEATLVEFVTPKGLEG